MLAEQLTHEVTRNAARSNSSLSACPLNNNVPTGHPKTNDGDGARKNGPSSPAAFCTMSGVQLPSSSDAAPGGRATSTRDQCIILALVVGANERQSVRLLL